MFENLPQVDSRPQIRERASNLFRRMFMPAFGDDRHFIARWIFLRALALIYFSAFFSLLFQVRGLIGPNGLLPANQYLPRVAHAFGPLRFWYAPTLLWLSSGSHMLMAICWVGLAASVLAALNLWPRLNFFICFVCYLSFIGAAQDFASYQSDGMLLAAGFLVLFLAPRGVLPGWGLRSIPIRAARLLLIWEWFRIYFESGVAKLVSGDPTWRNFTAMYHYYQNGPLPTWIGWYLQHLPHWFQKATAGATLVMELGIVFLAFLPRRWRIFCFCFVTAWQIGVILTANYAFLNYLVLALGILLLEDQTLLRFVPARWRKGFRIPRKEAEPVSAPERIAPEEIQEPTEIPASAESSEAGERPAAAAGTAMAEGPAPEAAAPAQAESPAPAGFALPRPPRWRRTLRALRVDFVAVMLCWVLYATTLPAIQLFWHGVPLPEQPAYALAPFRIANRYGLFAIMTRHRYLIEFQGSDDGVHWKAYPYRYQPQNVHQAPGIYAPYQPRFDWNMWFASLGGWRQYPYVVNAEASLLTDDQAVIHLFAGNPFPSAPPRYVRAVVWQYRFSTPRQKRTQGIWWTRKLLGIYAPPLERTPSGKIEVYSPSTRPLSSSG